MVTVTQEFLDSTKVTYITGNDLLNVNNDCIYVLHPALTKSIDKLQRKKIKHFNLFVLGKGMSVPQDKLMQLVADYRNNTIKKNTGYKPFHWNKNRFLLERVTNAKIEE